jgi:hypothetical protein
MVKRRALVSVLALLAAAPIAAPTQAAAAPALQVINVVSVGDLHRDHTRRAKPTRGLIAK